MNGQGNPSQHRRFSAALKYQSATLIILISLMITACSPLQQTPGISSPAPPLDTPFSEIGPPTETPTGPVRILYGSGAEPVLLDPGAAIDLPSVEIMYNIYDGLIVLGVDGLYKPSLATEWTISPDQLSWTFRLREGVKFHDGSDFNAEAVKYNIERVMDEANNLATTRQWTPFIDSVDVIDAHTVAIVTKEPFGSLPRLLSRFGLFISPSAVEEHGEDVGRHPSGTGPYMLESWNSGRNLVLVRNPDYWGEGPYIDEVEVRWYREDSSRVLALGAGDVDVIANVPAASISLLEDNPSLEVHKATRYSLFYWAFNTSKDPWSDPLVRQALNYAIDRESLVEHVLLEVGAPAEGFISPNTDGSITLDQYTYDPQKARQLLIEADYPFDYEAKAFVTEGRYYADRQVAEAIQGMLAEVGVKVNIEVLEFGAFVDAIWSAPVDSEIAQARDFMQTAYGNEDPASYLYQVLHCDSWPPEVFNEAFYCNQEVSDLIDRMNATTDINLRREALVLIQEIMADDPPWIFSHFTQEVIAYKTVFEGLSIHPASGVRFHEVKLQP